jgi:hypothetical protein
MNLRPELMLVIHLKNLFRKVYQLISNRQSAYSPIVDCPGNSLILRLLISVPFLFSYSHPLGRHRGSSLTPHLTRVFLYCEDLVDLNYKRSRLSICRILNNKKGVRPV